MLDVEDEEPVVVGFFRRDADTGPARGVFGRVVDAHVDGRDGRARFVVVDGDEAGLSGRGEGLIFDEAVGGVFLVPEMEAGEPVAGGVAVDEGVGCQCRVYNGGDGHECGDCR